MRSLNQAVAVCAGLVMAIGTAKAAPVESIYTLAKGEESALLKTLEGLVSIESGSQDLEGLDKIAGLVAGRLEALGGKVSLITPAEDDIYKMQDTPSHLGKAVLAKFTGKGTKKILLLAHMDTVYLRGMGTKQPFHIDGNRAYGLAIADDKQGVSVILHLMKMLQALKFQDYAQITVLIDGDEEISSPGSRNLITRLGAENDFVFSFEASLARSDRMSIATAGIASVTLNVTGKASHAGSAPELGRNALYELSHQVLQTKDLSDSAKGIKMNWTLANAGNNRNVIPANASAVADVRVLRVADYDGLEQRLNTIIKNQLIPDAKVEMLFERRRPPLEETAVARRVVKHAQGIYTEIGKQLEMSDVAEGGGTDAAFASLKTTAPVVERCGLPGFGMHTADNEYVLTDAIVPRLYLMTRLIMDAAQGKIDLSH